MPAAGNYTDRVQLLVRTSTVNDIGEPEELFVPNGYLWCSYTEDNSRRAGEYGGNQTGVDGTFFLNNYPEVTTLDMLRDSSDRVWKIEGIRKGDNETICDCYTDDSLTDWVEDGGSSD